MISKVERPAGRHQLKTRVAMRDALLELLRRQTLEQISVNDIIASANVGKATFYRHYSNKDELLADLAVDEIRDLLNFAVPLFTPASNLESARALCMFVDARRPLWTALLTGGAAHQVRAEYIRQSREQIPKRLRRERALLVEAAAIYSSAGTFELLAWWLGAAPDYSAKQIAGILDALVIVPELA